jgi:hypothetical protein
LVVAVNETDALRLVNITDKSNPMNLNKTYTIPYKYSCNLEVKDNFLIVHDYSNINIFEFKNDTDLDLLYKIEIIKEYSRIERLTFYNDYMIAVQTKTISIFDLNNPSNSTVNEIEFEAIGFFSFEFGVVDNSRLYTAINNEYKEYTLAIYNLTDILNIELIFPTTFTTPFPFSTTAVFVTLLQVMMIIIYYRTKRKSLAY